MLVIWKLNNPVIEWCCQKCLHTQESTCGLRKKDRLETITVPYRKGTEHDVSKNYVYIS